MVEAVVVNYWAVLVSAIASMIIGSLWYSPVLFGNIWMKLSNINKKDMDKAKQRGMWKLYLIALISSVVMAYVLAHFVSYVGAVNVSDALQLAFWTWLGFIATVLLGSVLWEGKNVKIYLLTVIYYLVNLAVMSIILTLWQ